MVSLLVTPWPAVSIRFAVAVADFGLRNHAAVIGAAALKVFCLLLSFFHLSYSCRLVARLCHECIQTRETYGLLTNVYLFFGV